MNVTRLALEELASRNLFERWRKYPLLWVKERLQENPANYSWSDLSDKYKSHTWDGDKNPLATAWQHLGDCYSQSNKGKPNKIKNIALESATSTGKTYWLARVVFWFLDCFENSLVVTSAPSDNQLKIGLWAELNTFFPKIKKLRPNANKYKTRLALDDLGGYNMEEFEGDLTSESWHAVMHVAGVKADEVSANKARGFHRENMLIILEECAGIPLSILTAFQNTCTGNMNFILAVGNPNNEFDTLHQFTKQKNCLGLRASGYDHPNIVMEKEYIGGAVTKQSIQDRIDIYGKDAPLTLAMTRGLAPAQKADGLIKIEWVEECINTNNNQFGVSYNAVGVDVANSFDGDKACTAWGEGNTLIRVDEFHCNNATHLAYNLVMDSVNLQSNGYTDYNIPNIQDYNIEPINIGIDGVGVGVATVNAFIDMGLQVQSLEGGSWKEAIIMEERWEAGRKKSIPMYNFQSLRSQMYWQLREDIRLKRINIHIEDKIVLNQLIKEICIPRVIADKNKITIEGKEEIKKKLDGKSPNIADAVVYWNWMRLGYRVERKEFIPVYGGY